MLARLRPPWPLITFAVSASMLAAAHLYFQRLLGLDPCPLCLDQREWHWAVLGASAVGFVLLRFRPGLGRWVAFGLGLVFLASFGMIPIPGLPDWPAGAAYHVAVEQGWIVAQCEAQADLGDLTFDPSAPLDIPSCDEIVWDIFGVSMAGYNALVSFALALLSFAVALAPERKP